MLLCFYDDFVPGFAVGTDIVPIPESLTGRLESLPQQRLVQIIDRYEADQDGFERCSRDDGQPRIRRDQVTLRPPVPQPGQLLCAVKNYLDDRTAKQADFFLKSPRSIIGHQEVVRLPPDQARVFHHEAELAVVVGREVSDESAAADPRCIFGYTGFIDVSARDLGSTYYQKKSFATFGPLGPVIATRNEVPDPTALQVCLTVNGEVRQRFTPAQMSEPISALIELAARVGGLSAGDVVATGTHHDGMGSIADGDRLRLSIDTIGDLEVSVRDQLDRRW